MLNILYIGPNDSEWAQEHCPCSLAAAKWSRGFLTALSKVTALTALTHTYYYPWPKGNLLWSSRDDRLYPTGWACEVVEYPVFRYIREWWWGIAYASKAKRIIREKKIDIVLMYNCYETWQLSVLHAMKKVYPKIKVIPIILDGDDPRKDDWGWIKRAAVYSDAFIALSWWIYQNIPSKTDKPAYHFDGGADGWRGKEPLGHQSLEESGTEDKRQAANGKFGGNYTLVHTGALDQWRGLGFMLDVVKSLTASRRDVKFIFCGKSSEKRLKEIFGNNSQVELPGFVSEEEMVRICNSADVLLNVRDPNHPDNILNYPSKLPHYLSFGRPIVSTKLESLSPDYQEVVNFPGEDSVDSYIVKLEEVLGWSDAQKEVEYRKIKDWFESRKSWDVMVDKLSAWLNEFVKITA